MERERNRGDDPYRRATHAAGRPRPVARNLLAAASCSSAGVSMKITGQVRIKAPRAAVFAALRDARFFASCVEGVRDLAEIAPDRYAAVLETKVAYMSFKFNVTVELTRASPPQ